MRQAGHVIGTFHDTSAGETVIVAQWLGECCSVGIQLQGPRVSR
jgi:hypothetical protein